MVRKQDMALTVDQLLLFGNISDKYWFQSNYEEENKELESTISFFTICLLSVSARGGGPAHRN